MAFDERLQPDVRAVLDAAAALDITEFDLFRLAYTRWHGEGPAEPALERFFVAYMFDDVVPVWVRHFARLVMRLAGRGVLDRVELGVKDLPRSREMVSRGVRYTVAIGAIIVTLMVLGEFAARFLRLGERCLFPPCY